MRALRALLIFLATLLGLALLAAWLAPRFMDWSRYRDDIARLAATALDRPVLIEGPISLSLLPQPTLTASAIRIADGPDEGAFSARELTLVVALGPLLAGRIEARELVLRGAELHIPWPLPDDALPVRPPAWLAGLSASVEDGRILIGGLVVSDIVATLTVGGPIGGYQLVGTARVYDRPWRFSAHLSGAGADLVSGLDATVQGEGVVQGIEARFSGRIGPDGAAGRFSARGPDLAQVLPAPKMPFSAEGRLTIAAGLAAADDLALQIGGAPASGAVSLRVAPSLRVDLALAASRLDLDAWLPVLLRGDGFSYPVGLDLSAEAAQFSGGLVRRLRADFELTPTDVQVHEVSATLPGDASLRVSGLITRAARQQPHFAGKVALSDPDLRGTLNWLHAPAFHVLSALPTGVLRSVDLAGEAAIDPDRIALTGLAGTLDASKASGDLTLALGHAGQPMSVRADATLERLELDPWLPASPPALSELSHRLAPLDADLRLHARKAVFQGIGIDNLVFDGATEGGKLTIRHLEGKAEGVQAGLSGAIDPRGRVTDGRLDLAAADATPFAALLPAAWRATPALWRVPCKAAIHAEGPPDALGVDLDLVLGDAGLQARSKLDVPDRQWSAAISLHHPAAAVLLRAAGFAIGDWIGDGPLAAEARLAGAPGRLGADQFELSAGMLRAGGQLALDRTGEQPRLSGRVTAERLPLPPLDVHAPSPLPLSALLGWQADVLVEAGTVLGGTKNQRPVLRQASATVTLAGGTLRLNGFAAKLASGTDEDGAASTAPLGGTLSGSASLDAASEPPTLALKATLADAVIDGPLTGLPLDVTGGRADGSFALTASGHSPAAMLATLGGDIRISLHDGKIAGFDLDALDTALAANTATPGLDQALQSALESGSTGFDRMQIVSHATRGILSLTDASLHASSGTAVVSGSIDLPDAELDLHATLHPAKADAPNIGLRLTGPFARPRHLPELADVTRWRAEHAAQ